MSVRGTLGIRWVFVCHSVRTFIICWMDTMHALPFVTMDAQHSFLIDWAFVLYIRGSLRNMFLSRCWAYQYRANVSIAWTMKKPTPNVRKVYIANAQRIHRVFISMLSYAQNVEHVQTNSETLAFFCVPQRTANVYHVRTTWHERMTTYTCVHTDLPVRRAYVSSIRNSVTRP